MAINFGMFSLDMNIPKSYTDLVSILKREQASVEDLKGSTKKQLGEYKSWVYSCVSLIQERVSTIPYGFYSKSTGDQIKPNKHQYKNFSKPFVRPNNLMTFRFLKSFALIQLDLCGMAVIYPARNRLGQIWELWPINMNDFIGIKASGSFMPDEVIYSFNFGSKTIDFNSKELIIINYPNPFNPFEPMSPIQAHAYAVDIDRYVEVYQRDFFKNSARVDMALATDQPIDQEKADELRDRWITKYAGNYHDVAVLSNGLKPVPIKYTNKDFEFLHLAEWSLDKIVSAYHIPLSKLGFSKSDRAGNVMDDISFNRECIQPRLTLLDEELTQGVLEKDFPDIELKHSNPIPRDRQIEVQEARVFLAGTPCMTINEYREERKLPKVPGGERILVPSTFVPLDRLDENIDNQNSSNSSETDPTRHDNDKPHVNPDGTDDRDDLPTDGRGLNESLNSKLGKFYSIERNFREHWVEHIHTSLKDVPKEDLKIKIACCFKYVMKTALNVLFDYFDSKDITYDEKVWVLMVSERAAVVYQEALLKEWEDSFKWNEYLEKQIKVNTKMAKITNYLLRATINYSKWLVMVNNNIKISWVVNSNSCGHKGRLTDLGNGFGIGVSKVDFPNQTLTYDCDCTIEPKK